MLKVLTTRGEKPLEVVEARRLLDRLARKFDANFDGKFNYTGRDALTNRENSLPRAYF